MKEILLYILVISSLNLFAQNETKLVFYDACKAEIIELNYSLRFHDDTIEVNSNQAIKLEQGYYFLTTQIESKDWISTFYFDFHIGGTNKLDTLYLNKLRYNWNGALHPQIVKYYYCDEIAQGVITELDNNNIIRAKGKFQNGEPISNILYFDKNEDRVEKYRYNRNGQLKGIKKYRKKN